MTFSESSKIEHKVSESKNNKDKKYKLFLKTFWKNAAKAMNYKQVEMLNKFYNSDGRMIKNSIINHGKYTKEKDINGEKIEIARMLFDNVIEKTLINNPLKLYEDIMTPMRAFVDEIEYPYQVACLSYFDFLDHYAKEWLEKASLYKIVNGKMGKAVIASVMASLFWIGMQHNADMIPTTEYNEILTRLYLDKCRGQDFWFTSNELATTYVKNGESISDIRTILSNDEFLLPIDGETPEESRTLIIPESYAWNEGKKFIFDHQKELIELGRQVYGHLKVSEDGYRENDPIVGIYAVRSKSSGSIAECQLYRTDYYTHRLMEQFIKQIGYLPSSNTYAFTENVRNCWLRTSLGVNVIVRLKKSKQIIIVERGELASYGNAGKYYPSVVETIDLKKRNGLLEPDDFSKSYSNAVIAAIVRGMWEELGIPVYQGYKENDIKVQSFFRTMDYNQDNFFAVVTLDDLSFDDILVSANQAPDFSVENNSILALKDDAYEIMLFILNNRDRMIAQTVYCLAEYLRKKKIN